MAAKKPRITVKMVEQYLCLRQACLSQRDHLVYGAKTAFQVYQKASAEHLEWLHERLPAPEKRWREFCARKKVSRGFSMYSIASRLETDTQSLWRELLPFKMVADDIIALLKKVKTFYGYNGDKFLVVNGIVSGDYLIADDGIKYNASTAFNTQEEAFKFAEKHIDDSIKFAQERRDEAFKKAEARVIEAARSLAERTAYASAEYESAFKQYNVTLNTIRESRKAATIKSTPAFRKATAKKR